MQTRDNFRYCAYYCEENVWQLCQEDELLQQQVCVVFVSNPQKSCALWNQRAAHSEDSAVVWDYHVLLLAFSEQTSGNGWKVWDLDTTLSFPCDARTYLQWTFAVGYSIPEEYRPLFRVMTREEYLLSFSSDRSHMRDDKGGWMKPPPPWPAPFQESKGMNLHRFFEMEQGFVGDVLNLDEMWSRFVENTEEG